MTAEEVTVTRWSMLASIVESQLNFEIDREDILELLRILHDYEAYEEYLHKAQSMIGPTVEINDLLFDHFSVVFDLVAWPAYVPAPREIVRSREVDERLQELDNE